MTAPSVTDSLCLPPRRPGRRVISLWFPHLRTERILRRRLGRFWRAGATPPEGDGDGAAAPLVVTHRENNTLRLLAIDEAAAALGLRPGMGLADARAMHPGIEAVEAEPEADRRLLEGLADWCDRYTPLVARDGEDGLFLDITGCAHLFGGEKAMLDDLLRRLFEQGFAARAAISSTPGTAWAMARHLGRACVEPGAETDAIAPLPLSALRLDAATCDGLEGLGLRCVGAILTAPRAPLTRRFGPLPVTRLDQALGRVEEAISPRLRVAPLCVERHLAEPVVLVDDIERLVLLLAGSLKSDLERRGEGARSLHLVLFRVDGAVRRLAVGASRPLRDPLVIHRLFREKLSAVADGLEVDCGFELVRLAATATAPFADDQADLDGSRTAQAEEDLALLADRVRARLGSEALAAPCLAQSHLPERAAVLKPFTEMPEPAAGLVGPRTTDAPRPIRLLPRPEPVEVAIAEVPEGPPAHFRWRRALHRVARAEGPERIAPEWWREPDETPARDYFRVEDEDGRRYWLYRQGLYGSAEAPRWFLHGIFA